MLKVFHVSVALILGLEDEPYDDIIYHRCSCVFLSVGTGRPVGASSLLSCPDSLMRRSASINAFSFSLYFYLFCTTYIIYHYDNIIKIFITFLGIITALKIRRLAGVERECTSYCRENPPAALRTYCGCICLPI
jgi:hypothetical protein